MQFYAGEEYGTVEVDEIQIEEDGSQVGVFRPNSFQRVTYWYRGPKLGCSMTWFTDRKYEEGEREAIIQTLSQTYSKIVEGIQMGAYHLKAQ